MPYIFQGPSFSTSHLSFDFFRHTSARQDADFNLVVLLDAASPLSSSYFPIKHLFDNIEDKAPALLGQWAPLYDMNENFNDIAWLCGCKECTYRYDLTVDCVKIKDTVTTERELATLQKQITDDALALQLRWLVHGKLAVDRWKNYPLQTRQQLLKKAWPDMPSSHRPDLQLYESFRNPSPTLLARIAHRILHHPHINVEDLSEGDNLVRMFESRATDPSESFLLSDLALANVSAYGHTKYYRFNEGRLVLVSRSEKDEKEGALALNDEIKSEKLKLDPGPDVYGLRIQASVYSILRNITNVLLKGMDLSNESLKTANPSNLDGIFKEESFDSLHVALARAPYRKPSGIDWSLIEDIVESRFSTARYHVKHMRENPPYLAGCYRQWMEHFGVLQEHRHVGLKWACVEDHRTLWMWHTIDEMLKDLKPRVDRPNVEAHLKYQQLQEFLYRRAKQDIHAITIGLVSSPTFSPHVRRQKPRDKPLLNSIADYELLPNASDAARKLFRLFHLLCSEDSVVFIDCTIVREIDRILNKDAAAAALMTPLLSERFGNLAGLVETSAQLALWEPHASLSFGRMSRSGDFYTAVNDRVDALNDEFDQIEDRIKAFIRERKIDPTQKQYECPLEAPSTKEIEMKQRQACRNLEIWWTDLHEELGWTRCGAKNGRLAEPWKSLVLDCAPEKLNYPWKWPVPETLDLRDEDQESPADDLPDGAELMREEVGDGDEEVQDAAVQLPEPLEGEGGDEAYAADDPVCITAAENKADGETPLENIAMQFAKTSLAEQKALKVSTSSIRCGNLADLDSVGYGAQIRAVQDQTKDQDERHCRASSPAQRADFRATPISTHTNRPADYSEKEGLQNLPHPLHAQGPDRLHRVPESRVRRRLLVASDGRLAVPVQAQDAAGVSLPYVARHAG